MEENKEFTSEMVDDYANKLLIGLTKEENKMVTDEFGVIDKNFKILESIPGLKEVEPMSWCLDRTIDNLREDVIEESIAIDDLLANSKNTTDREIEVPKVVG